MISVNFRESAIKAVTADLDGYTVYIGTGSGDLASFDMRTGMCICEIAWELGINHCPFLFMVTLRIEKEKYFY